MARRGWPAGIDLQDWTARIILLTCPPGQPAPSPGRGFACYVWDPATAAGAAGVVRGRRARPGLARRPSGLPCPGGTRPAPRRGPARPAPERATSATSGGPPTGNPQGSGRLPGRVTRAGLQRYSGRQAVTSGRRPPSPARGAGRGWACLGAAGFRRFPDAGPGAPEGLRLPARLPLPAAWSCPSPQRGGRGRPLIGYEQQCISRPVPDDPMLIGGYIDQGWRRAGCGAGGKASRTAGKGCALLSDLAALTPPAVVCVAFLIGVGLFLRHQLGPKRESAEDEYPEDISGDSGIPHSDGSQSDASQPAASPDRGER